MPIIKSSKKRVRVSEKKRAQNIAEKSALRTAIKRFETAVSENDPNSETYLKNAIKALDKAASKGLIHKNSAARKKPRLTKKLVSI